MTSPVSDAKRAAERRNGMTGGAVLVGAGIFLSRVMGLVRARAFTHFLGTS